MQLSEKFYRNDSCDEKIIKKVETELKKDFPKSYVDFLFWSNGGEGEIGENYISLWDCENITQLNNDYGIQKYLTEDFVAFGTDGGGNCFAFDFRIQRNPRIVKCALGDLDINELSYVAETFTEFVEILKHRKIE
jgi:SMI1 / KNR4 family.